ncbi:MAG: DUF3445 domain-containing protein, partial [Maritimibacter sp.]|nr:DUF3445 domain-containing protein [Maritimibacter sp.]
EPRTSRLPGLNPVAPGDWLVVDDVYVAQMALRDRLLAERGDVVLRQAPGAAPAAAELLALILEELAAVPGYRIGADDVACPDGRRVALDRSHPLETAARLVQEDLLILEQPEGAEEHVLTAGVLCFPASWSLGEKFLRPLTGIHTPVDVYDAELARRVQRLFDGIRAGRPMWRANALVYADPALFQPRTEADRRPKPPAGRRWLRSERQCLVRLPETRAVVFTIHTFVVPFERLLPQDRAHFSGTGAGV